MAGPDLSPLLRRLAALSDFRLGLAYAAGIFPSVLLQSWAEIHPGVSVLTYSAAVLAVIAVSLLLGVIAFYRDDDTVLSGILLAIIIGVGTGAGLVVSAALVTGSLGVAAILAVGGSLGLIVRLILLAPVMVAAVWITRRFRRYLAPDTVGSVGESGRPI